MDAFTAQQREPDAPDRSLAFMFVDLDKFKEVNDTFGHATGDELLRQLGARLEHSLRASDLVVRLGGDEFVVALLDAGADYAATVAGRLTAWIEEPFVLDAVRVLIGASIGIALMPADATEADDLVRCADLAMYRAKLEGKPFAIYQRDLDGAANRVQLVAELRETELYHSAGKARGWPGPRARARHRRARPRARPAGRRRGRRGRRLSRSAHGAALRPRPGLRDLEA
jgi:diguanylate cyclase (GGDEF)-like protein